MFGRHPPPDLSRVAPAHGVVRNHDCAATIGFVHNDLRHSRDNFNDGNCGNAASSAHELSAAGNGTEAQSPHGCSDLGSGNAGGREGSGGRSFVTDKSLATTRETTALFAAAQALTFQHTTFRVEVYHRHECAWEIHSRPLTRSAANETANRLRDHRGNANVRVVEEPSVVAVRQILERGRL